MSSAPAVALLQDGAEQAYWQRISFVRPHCAEDFRPPPARFMSGEFSSSGDELATKVRKPYTITKQRERWSEEEHQKFLEALKLYGRAWRQIEEHIGTKTAVQIRSHAQKFFSKLEREASTGGSAGHLKDIEIPPPRPKRKPSHPYPRKAGIPATFRPSAMDEDTRPSTETLSSFSPVSSISMQADIGSNRHKAAAFTPYISKTRPAMDAVHLQGISLGSPSSIRSQASMKLFGRTVVVPPTDRMAANKTDTLEFHMESPVGDSSKIVKKEKLSKDLLLKERLAESNTSMPKIDQKHRQAFSPYIKSADKAKSSCSSALSLDMRVLGSGICCLEGNGESHTREPCMNKDMQAQGSLPMIDRQCHEELDANSNIISREQLQMQEPVFQSIFPLGMPAQYIKNQGLEGPSDKKDDPFSGEETPPAVADSNNSDHSGDTTISKSAVTSNTSFDSLMENCPQYHTNLPAVSPHLGCGSTQLFGHGTGVFGMPWHFLQSAAFHHPAAYPAAMSAIGWPGLMAGHQTAKLLELGNSVQRHNSTSFLGDANATAVAAASAWWALHGSLLPGYSHPASGPVYGCAEVPIGTQIKSSAVTSVKPVDNIEVIESMEAHEQDQDPDATTDDEATTSEDVVESASEEHYERSTGQREKCAEWINESNTSRSATALQVSQGEVSCPSRESSVYEAGSPISTNAPSFADEETKRERELQNPGSSTDEGDGRRKRSREGSSSGSNTPLCGLQTSDPEILNTSGSDLSGMEVGPQKQCTVENACDLTDTGSQDCVNTGDCTDKNVSEQCKLSEAKDFQRNLGRGKTENSSISEIIINEKGCPKMRFKSLEKAERNQHKDRVGGEDGVKRFKSCAYDTEQWKEVSEEGRKAFQALFSHKTLPQTFSPPYSPAESKFHGGIIEKRKLKLSHTIKKLAAQDFQVSHGSAPQSEAEIDCSNLALLPQKGGDTTGVQDTPAGGLLEEIETGEKDMRNQENNPGTGSEKGGSSILSKLNHSEMIGVTSLHGHNDVEDHPKIFRPLNSRKHVSAVISCRGNSQSRSGFVPYQRPSLETVSYIKKNVVPTRQNISKGLVNGSDSKIIG